MLMFRAKNKEAVESKCYTLVVIFVLKSNIFQYYSSSYQFIFIFLKGTKAVLEVNFHLKNEWHVQFTTVPFKPFRCSILKSV